MIVFDPIKWTISLPPGESVIARQYDNLTRSITVTGAPDGWDWTLLVQASGKLDLIDLEPVEGGVGVTLTAQQLSLADSIPSSSGVPRGNWCATPMCSRES